MSARQPSQGVRAGVAVAVATVSLLALAMNAAPSAVAAQPTTPMPYWRLEVRPAPTNLQPNEEAQIIVTATNAFPRAGTAPLASHSALWRLSMWK